MNRTSNEVRRAFLDFFVRHGHEEVASGPLVPANDPSLLFANAGMVQFKDLFTGRERRPYVRATSSQKCIRISGKHNDLEAVGPSPRHHTFFEMLGNFSFGDYFKEEAIVFAWEFLTRVLDLPKDKLIITYFQGEEGISPDHEARDLWHKLTGFGEDRIRGLGMADNFWQMGDTGPCGPCSEIHFYHGEGVRLEQFGEEQTPEGFGWMEIWNLVFMQFERALVDGQPKLTPLPKPSIDTGAGLERVSGVVQNKTSNYDVDLLRELVEMVATLANIPYRGSMQPDDVSMRVIADHARTTAFLIAEGILPDRSGREYVLRRVMRRAIRHGHRLGIKEPFLYRIADQVITRMGGHFSELSVRGELIRSIAEQEEVRFRGTIERGLGILEDHFRQLLTEKSGVLAGTDAFQLYDTFGFPLDLTEVICRERGFSVDVAGYEQALSEARARSEWKGADKAVEDVYHALVARLPSGGCRFTGYDRHDGIAKVQSLLIDGVEVDRATEGERVVVVVDETPFYAESGGQVGDQGTIRGPSGVIQIEDTGRPLPGLWVHHGRVIEGTVARDEEVALQIDVERRDATRRHHSATHLLHLALRRVLGEHAQQKGSVVDSERLRFDFTHDRPLSEAQLRALEEQVNRGIIANHPVRTEILDIDTAKARGAMMIFEEKYGEVVRMLTMGDSVELCGGTHVRATGDIGSFKIQSEQGIAAGVRRIVAVTGMPALAYAQELESRLQNLAEKLRGSPHEIIDKVTRLMEKTREQAREIEKLTRQLAEGRDGGIEGLLAQAKTCGAIRVLSVRTEVTDKAALRELAEQLRDRLGDAVVLLGSVADEKAQLVLTVAKSLTNQYKAGELIREIAAVVGGSGGGRPDMAQAGGTMPEKLEQALSSLVAKFDVTE